MSIATEISTLKWMDEMGGDPNNKYELLKTEVDGYVEIGGKKQLSSVDQTDFKILYILGNTAPALGDYPLVPIGSTFVDRVTGEKYTKKAAGWVIVG
jgi:hypothetical protein